MRGGRFVTVVALAAALLPSAPASGQAPDLRGRFLRNDALSEDVERKALEALGGGKTVGQDAQEASRVQMRQAILAILPALGQVEIEQAEGEVKIVDADDNVRIFYLGREHLREGRLGRKIRCSSAWKGEQLVVTESTDDGKLTEVFTAVPAKRQLLYALRLEDRRLKTPLDLRIVYDAAPRP
jgi:hypothetical protein